MQIEQATCPACSRSFDPLRARAVTVIDGRVRAFCSPACRDRGIQPAPSHPTPTTDAHQPSAPPRKRYLPTEQLVMAAAALVVLAIFVVMIRIGQRRGAAAAALSSSMASAAAASPMAASTTTSGDPSTPDVWIQPLAGASAHRVVNHDRRLFSSAREGVPEDECALGRCAVDLEARGGEVVMAVHDGVIEAVERDPDAAMRRGQEGRFVRINHKGGSLVSTYLQLDGIREDLRPGIPVAAGEPIGTVASSAHPHLRLAVSVHKPEERVALYIDPQPLLALWPTLKRAPSSLHAMETDRTE